MRARFWALIAAMLVLGALAIGLGGCTPARVAANTPVPTKTLRPTFTATIPKPTLTPSPAAGQSNEQAPAAQVDKPTAEPTATAVPPTAAPSPTPEPAAFTVNSASVNVRSGPGTTYPILGRLTQGQSFPIEAKSEDGDWWQFEYNGKPGWVISSNVAAKGAESVEVAENIPAPPTAAPRPTARPAAPKPAQPPAQPAQPAPAATKYGASGTGVQPNTNDYVTVFCLAFNQNGSLASGKLRVSRDGQVVGTADFRAEGTYYLSSGYNAGCKVEVSPAVNGTYTAVLVEGDQVVSDPINFTVTGPENRIQFVAWKAR
jgi:uncharacterized protein YgiM (DUF1202 family)